MKACGRRWAPGPGVLYDGQWWEVAELAAAERPAGAAASAPAGQHQPPARRRGHPPWRAAGAPAGTASLRLAGLDDAELAGLRERVAHVREALHRLPPRQRRAGPAGRAAAGVRAGQQQAAAVPGQGG